MDLSYMIQTNQPRYALTVIDILNIYDVQPMNNNDSHSVCDALQKSFAINEIPYVYSGDDGAFKSKVKESFGGEDIKHIIALTHANVVERFIISMKQGINELIQFNKASWTDIFKHVLNKLSNPTHSSTSHTPKEAHKDTNTADVDSNLQLKQVSKRRYPNLSNNDYVKYIENVTVSMLQEKKSSRWSETRYEVIGRLKYYV